MFDRFLVCQPITASWEGGWSDHPADPGGKTMYGVTEASWHAYEDKIGWPRTPVRSITRDQALSFYRSEFWEKINGSQLHAGVDLAVYDASVNSGVSRGMKWLKAAAGSNDHSVTVKKICRARLSFMQSLKIWKTFGKGWGRRVADIEVRGVAMALAAMGATPGRVQADAQAEVSAAKTTAATADKAAKTTGTGAAASAGTPVIDPTGLDASALWILGGMAVALAIVAALLIVRQRAATARADAYKEVLA